MECETFRVKDLEDASLDNVLKLNRVEDIMCRICFEDENDNNPLINPCKCNGSIRFVHEECLKI